MSPLVPAPDALPAPWGLLRFLLLLVFPLHLLFMNAMLGAAAVAFALHVRGGGARLRLAHELARALPFLVAFAVNFGVASLLFLQALYGQFFYTSSILMALFWLAVVPLVMTAYALLYLYDFRFSQLGNPGAAIVGGSLLVFLVTAFVFSNNMTLMLAPAAWAAFFANSPGIALNLADSALWPRYLHFIVGGMAVGGLFVAVYGRVRGRRDPELATLATAAGMRLFATLTMAQLVVGPWFLVTLPRAVLLRFLGGDGAATLLLLAGILLVFASLAAGLCGKVGAAAVLTPPLVCLMAVLRDFVRTGYLAPGFDPALTKVVPQHSPAAVFLLAAAAGAVAIAWMIRTALKVHREAGLAE